MESILCFAAQGIVEDKRGGAITAYNILEDITAEGFPFFIQQLAVVNVLVRDEDEPDQVEVLFRVSNGENTLIERDLPVDFEGTRKNRVVVRINGLVVENPAPLSFEFIHDEEVMGAYNVPAQARAPEVEAGEEAEA